MPEENARPNAGPVTPSAPEAVTRPPADPRKWAAWARSFPGGHLLVLRAFLGVTFCFAGLQKLANRGFFYGQSSIKAQLKASARSTPVGSLLHPAIHVAVLIGVVIAFSEIAVGLGTLLGLFSRVAATGGMLLALSFFLTVSYNDNPYYFGPDIVFVFAWTALALNGAGALSLDAYFTRLREHELLSAAEAQALAGPVPESAVNRRVAIAKMATAGLVGGFGIFLGGVSAAAGRIFAKHVTAESGAGTFPTTSAPATTASPGTGTGIGTTTPKSTVPHGKLLGAATAVPVGGALGFTDPFQNIPAYVLQPKAGEYVAFSAICTHAGCTVAFVQSAEEFQCPCHGSIYSAATGDVIQGPAPLPLPAIRVVESGGDLYVTN
jgi:thiosulfate dehydrogenase [quinone] large subunit